MLPAMSLFTAGSSSSYSVPIIRSSNWTAGEASSSSSPSSDVPTAVSRNKTAGEAAFSSSSSSSSAERLIYDVFLSFRGRDTRHGFISHLYNALKQKGISTFKDDLKLERGKLISPEILRVIRQSRFSIVVFSRDYASSPWCLEELQTIIQCMEEKEAHVVLPVFYGLDPSDVSEVKSSYAESFAKHEQDFPDDAEMLRSWRAALSKAAGLSGWDSRNRDEPTLIDEVVSDLLNKLGRDCSNRLAGLVGMESRIKDMMLLLRPGLVDVRMVGIWGMAGIGKTTTAEVVYHHISHKFDACCFLKNVKEVVEKHGMDHLRNKLLSSLIMEDGSRILDEQLDVLLKQRLRNKCVLIVLDDVSCIDQLTSLVGDREWFGPGSRVIITTKDKHLLEQHEVDSVFEVKPLSNSESLQLFRQHAFKKLANSPTQDLIALPQRVVNYAQGLPLALKVLGSSLFNLDTNAWKSKLNALEEVPPQDIVKILRVSFDGLDRNEKSIFLDIACFFRGHDEEYVVSILEGRGSSASYALKVLAHRSLVSIQDNKVQMHDLLQQMGWEVVRQECINDVGKWSRLWNHQDVCNVLAQKMVGKWQDFFSVLACLQDGTNNVEGIVLDISKANELSTEVENFDLMNRLRLLKICYVHKSGISEYLIRKESCVCSNNCKGNGVSIWGKSKTLSHELRSLQWAEHAYKRLKRMITTAEGSKLKNLSNELRCLHWHGYPFESLPANFYPRDLVEFNLSYSRLKSFWTGEKKAFDTLKFMKLSGSQELTHTPDFSLIQNLEILILEGCIKLIEVHPSVGSLGKLAYLNLEGCKSLQSLPPTIRMRSLEVLTLSGCSKLKTFPEVEGNMESLSELFLDGMDIAEIPASIQMLTGLVVLSVTGCKRLEFIPEGVSRCRALKILRLSNCRSLRKVQFELNLLENLEEIHADGTALRLGSLVVDSPVKKLRVLTIRGSNSRPSVTQRLGINNPISDHYHFTSSLQPSLTTLDLSHCNLHDPFCDISSLVHLRRLDLSGNHFRTLYNEKFPEKLEVLILANCRKLGSFGTLRPALYRLEAPNCPSLGLIFSPAGSKAGRMRGFNFLNCFRLSLLVDKSGILQVKGKVAVALLTIHVEKAPSHLLVDELSIIAPDSSIVPQWLPYQHMGSTAAAVMLPPDGYHNVTLRGLAVWATFHVRGSSVAPTDLSLEFRLRSSGRNVISEIGFELSSGTKVESAHMWMRFVPVYMFKTVRRRESWSRIEAVVLSDSLDLVVASCGLVPIFCHQDGRLVDIDPASGLFVRHER